MTQARNGTIARRSRPGGTRAPLTPTERTERGKSARAQVPRRSHAIFDPPADRPDPVGLLERQAASRVPDLVPVRYGRMLVSPFTFFRGAASVMASDLAGTPTSGLTVQACGDAHLSNFGVFASPERRLVFDVNDFDETLPGPWEWDVKRLAASLEVAAREKGFTRRQRNEITLRAAGRYREAMRGFAAMSNLAVWYARADVDQVRAQLESQLSARQRKAWDRGTAKARTADSMRELARLTRTVAGRRRIVADPPLIVPVEDLLPAPAPASPSVSASPSASAPASASASASAWADAAGIEAQLTRLIARYRRTLETDRRVLLEQFKFADMARKVVGIGSVGTRCWIILMLGRDDSDALFLQVKEAQRSVLEPFVGASTYANEGQRVVAGQRLMQAVSDIFLGWNRIEAGLDGKPRDFYVRQLRDWKLSFNIAAMPPDGMRLYGELCGWTLARAHARSGDRIAIAAYLGKTDVFDQAVAQFASAYADQNERDHRALARAAASRRITARRDV